MSPLSDRLEEIESVLVTSYGLLGAVEDLVGSDVDGRHDFREALCRISDAIDAVKRQREAGAR